MDHSAVRIAVAVIEHQGRYLIGQRPAGVALAGLWEFPGGKQLADESAEQAAVRETAEETGLAVEALGHYGTVTQAYSHGTVAVTFVACRVNVPIVAPTAPFRWVTAAELAKYEFPAANTALVRRLIDESTRAPHSR